MNMITFAESTTNSLSQITFATLAANLFRHYLQCCIAFYFRARGARCSCPFSSEIRGRNSITAFVPGRGKPLLCQWALDFTVSSEHIGVLLVCSFHYSMKTDFYSGIVLLHFRDRAS